MRRALGVLAGNDMPKDLIGAWVRSADYVICADGGYDHLHALGLEPDVVVGDMDSIRSQPLRAALLPDADENTTDCDKLLAHAQAEGFESITLVGVEGDLLDHILATLFSAVKAPLNVRLGLRSGVAWLLSGGNQVRIQCADGARISLLPLLPCQGAHLAGVKWPFASQALSPIGFQSVSNRAEGTEIEASLGQGAALLFVEFPAQAMPFW